MKTDRRSIGVRVALAALACGGFALTAGSTPASARPVDLQKELGDTRVGSQWIYDDLEAGFARARREKKPLLALFR